VLPLVSALGFAAEVSHCHALCGLTWRRGDRGATNDMLVRSLDIQCGARAKRAAAREAFLHPNKGWAIRDSTHLIRAALLNDLPGVLRLIQLGAPLDLVSPSFIGSALYWACYESHADVAMALLDGKYEGAGADVDVPGLSSRTPLMLATQNKLERVVVRLLELGASVMARDNLGQTELGYAYDKPVKALLLVAGAQL